MLLLQLWGLAVSRAAFPGDCSGQSLQGHSRVVQWEAAPSSGTVQVGGKEVQLLVLGECRPFPLRERESP